ncbi:glycosyltransferase [Nocardia sp. NPDC050717]|uniref:glycosyltransferase n=1 Tax=Nocardia sp. NPDC050717 TaxID=3157221 RepID=UPI003410E160
MAEYLIVTWDGAGNLVPTLGTIAELRRRGNQVTVLGHDTIADRVDPLGARFIPLSQPPGWDELADPTDSEAEIRLMITELSFSRAIADDVTRLLNHESFDAVVVDCLLYTAIDAAIATGAPTANLVHTPYTILRDGPLMAMFAPGIELANAHRADLGLPPIARLGDIHDACAMTIVAVPSEFEPPIPLAANAVRVGPMLDAPPLATELDTVDLTGEPPLVLVSMSTSEQGQAEMLNRCATAIANLPVRAIITTGSAVDPSTIPAGPNTQVVRYTPHTDILPATDLVITHAGLGTTLAALGHGVPLVCLPMGRDQFFNAERVQAIGAGVMLTPDAISVDAIATAATTVLTDPTYHAKAHALSTAIATYPGAPGAAALIESLTAPAPSTP